MNVRTDLALEARELAGASEETEGVKSDARRFGTLAGEVVEITDPHGSRVTGKPAGRYLTLDVGRVWEDGADVFREKAEGISAALKSLMPPEPGTVLVAGLGNRFITADAVGPLVADSLIVTRHIKTERPELFGSLGLGEVCALCPGVLGQTGMETADVLARVCKGLSPSLVIAVDALAARRVKRLATTVQLSDTGFSPGSGVANRRTPVDRDTMGCQVISVGVPTVVDAATLVRDSLELSGADADEQKLERWLDHAGLNFFVTPKESDSIMRSVGRLIAYAINLALNAGLDYDAMVSLAAG